MKLQSAMEYLTTYGWAILIIGLALAVLFEVITTSTQNQAPQCLPPAGFACTSFYISQNGLLTLNLLQSTQNPIQITAVGCNNPQSINYMDTAHQPDFPTTSPANVPIGSNITLSIQCYSNATAYFGQINQYYNGYVVINYTNAYTNFPNTVFGKLIVKVVK